MNWKKAIRKGFEAGVPAALGAAGVTSQLDTTNQENFAASIGAAIAGFLFGAIKNWLKHRKWK